jgi:hypothetical protein
VYKVFRDNVDFRDYRDLLDYRVQQVHREFQVVLQVH